MPNVHEFRNMSTGDVYDETQCSDAIQDGDVLVVWWNNIPVGGARAVVAVMVEAWPVYLFGDEAGEFHVLWPAWMKPTVDDMRAHVREFKGGRYVDSFETAAKFFEEKVAC